MKRYDPRRADSRSLAEKLVGLYAAATAQDLAEANKHLAEANAMLEAIQNGGKSNRFSFRFPTLAEMPEGEP